MVDFRLEEVKIVVVREASSRESSIKWHFWRRSCLSETSSLSMEYKENEDICLSFLGWGVTIIYMQTITFFFVVITIFRLLCLPAFRWLSIQENLQGGLNGTLYLICGGRLFSYSCPCLRLSCLVLI